VNFRRFTKTIGFIIVSCITAYTGFSQNEVAIIIDTDIAPDYDDVGAIAVLHSLADRGEAKFSQQSLATYLKRQHQP